MELKSIREAFGGMEEPRDGRNLKKCRRRHFLRLLLCLGSSMSPNASRIDLISHISRS